MEIFLELFYFFNYYLIEFIGILFIGNNRGRFLGRGGGFRGEGGRGRGSYGGGRGYGRGESNKNDFGNRGGNNSGY